MTHREQAVLDAVQAGIFTRGPNVHILEEEFAASVGAPAAVAVSSGTAALQAILLAHRIGHGDEVIIPAHCFCAVPVAVRRVGATPVPADVLPDEWTISPAGIDAVMTGKTRAVIAVNTDGFPARFDEIREVISPGLLLVEDACASYGSSRKGIRTGHLGDAAAFSLNQTKIVSAGEGGLVTSSSIDLIQFVTMARDFGLPSPHTARRAPVVDGDNWKLAELEAVLARESLREFRENKRRALEVQRILDRAFWHSQHFLPPVTDRDTEVIHYKYRVRLRHGVTREDGENLLDQSGIPVLRQDEAGLAELPGVVEMLTRTLVLDASTWKTSPELALEWAGEIKRNNL